MHSPSPGQGISITVSSACAINIELWLWRTDSTELSMHLYSWFYPAIKVTYGQCESWSSDPWGTCEKAVWPAWPPSTLFDSWVTMFSWQWFSAEISHWLVLAILVTLTQHSSQACLKYHVVVKTALWSLASGRWKLNWELPSKHERHNHNQTHKQPYWVWF